MAELQNEDVPATQHDIIQLSELLRTLFTEQLVKSHDKAEELMTEITNLKLEKKDLTKDNIILRTQMCNLTDKVEHITKEKDAAAKTFAEDNDTHTASENTLKQKNDELSEKVKSLQQVLDDTRKQCKTLEITLSLKRDQYSQQLKENERLESELQEKSQLLKENAMLEEKMKTEKQEMESKLKKEQAKCNSLTEQLNTDRIKLNNVNAQCETLDVNNHKYELRMNSLEKNVSKMTEENEQLQNEITDLQTAANSQESRYKTQVKNLHYQVESFLKELVDHRYNRDLVREWRRFQQKGENSSHNVRVEEVE